MERVELIKSKQQAIEYLNATPAKFAEHIKQVHGGIPASTCHRCLSYRQGINSNNWFLRDLEKGLFGPTTEETVDSSKKLTQDS